MSRGYYDHHKPRRRTGGLWLMLLLGLPVAIIIMPTSMLVIAGMVPTFVAGIIDRDPEKSAALTVGAMNLCGVAPYIVELWQRGHTIAISLQMLATPSTWVVMFGAAAFGWLLYFFIPQIVTGIITVRAQSKIRDLEERRSLLVAEWGTDIMARPTLDQAEPQGMFPAEAEEEKTG